MAKKYFLDLSIVFVTLKDDICFMLEDEKNRPLGPEAIVEKLYFRRSVKLFCV